MLNMISVLAGSTFVGPDATAIGAATTGAD
jgi:hypothetical protein